MRVLTALLFALSLSAALLLAAPQAPAKPELETVLDRAGWYLDYFVDEFENVVAEENYIQDSSQSLPTISPAGGGRGAVAPPPSAAEMLRARHRDLRSDFLLVKAPDTEALVPFRDVIQVDGIMVRDREQRLAKLFLTASSDTMIQAEHIREEGARYNLGNMRSTLGNPVLALGVLQQSYQPRFRFSLGKEDRSFGPGVAVLEYKEVGSPAMIRGEAGRDLPAHGRLWVDIATGRVLKTELQVEQPAVRASITTTFQAEEKSGIAVPLEMREQYTFPSGNRVNTVASYGRFRRFDVNANERYPDADRHRQPTPGPAWSSSSCRPAASRWAARPPRAGRNDDELLHDVEITRPFFMGQHEVTQQEWRTVMGDTPSHFSTCGPRCPAENITYFDVQKFLDKMNAHTPHTMRYRLPTEAEWEYACRARTTGPFSTGENLTTAQANYNGRQPYGQFPAGRIPRRRQRPPGRFRSTHGDSRTCTATSGNGRRTGTGRTSRAPARTSIRTVRHRARSA